MKGSSMKKATVALTALALLASTALTSTAQARTWDAIKQAGTIKIATEGAFPPFASVSMHRVTPGR